VKIVFHFSNLPSKSFLCWWLKMRFLFIFAILAATFVTHGIAQVYQNDRDPYGQYGYGPQNPHYAGHGGHGIHQQHFEQYHPHHGHYYGPGYEHDLTHNVHNGHLVPSLDHPISGRQYYNHDAIDEHLRLHPYSFGYYPARGRRSVSDYGSEQGGFADASGQVGQQRINHRRFPYHPFHSKHHRSQQNPREDESNAEFRPLQGVDYLNDLGNAGPTEQNLRLDPLSFGYYPGRGRRSFGYYPARGRRSFGYYPARGRRGSPKSWPYTAPELRSIESTQEEDMIERQEPSTPRPVHPKQTGGFGETIKKLFGSESPEPRRLEKHEKKNDFE